MDVLGAGYALIAPNQDYPQKLHPQDHYFEWERGRILSEYQILFISEGSGVVETKETGVVQLTAPSFLILFPGTWHRYRPDKDKGWKEHWIAFDGEYSRSLQQEGVIDPKTPLYDVGHNETLLSQIHLIHEEVAAEALGFRQITASAIIQILALAINIPYRQKEESQQVRSVVRKACFLMRERANGTLSPEALSKELNIGYTYFRRMFKKYTGMSPKRYHTQLRLEQAKRLLLHTSLNVGQIAEKLEFDSPFHFSSWFKKNGESSPSNWRSLRQGTQDISPSTT